MGDRVFFLMDAIAWGVRGCDRKDNVGARHQQIMVKMRMFVSPCPGPDGNANADEIARFADECDRLLMARNRVSEISSDLYQS